MSIETISVLIVGFDTNIEDEEKIDELAEKLDCDYVSYNYGYDTLSRYALVPNILKSFKGKIKLDQLPLVISKVNMIKDKATTLGISLNEPIITAHFFTY